MPQRHSKNNNNLPFFTYHEKRKLGYGTQKVRLGKDSIKPFDACSLCLNSLVHPMSCKKGHIFCKRCILGCLSQKKDIQRTMKAATPAPSTSYKCPEGNEKLTVKTLFHVSLTEDAPSTYVCPSCRSTLTNTMPLMALSSCGHVFCKNCCTFMAVDKLCIVCNKPFKEKHLVNLKKGGTGFAAHDDNIEVAEFKHFRW